MSEKPTPEQQMPGQLYDKVLAAVREKIAKAFPGLEVHLTNRCPRCGGQMIHSRLRGYHCFRECQS